MPPPTPRKSPRYRRLAAVALGVALGLVALEVVMQVGAWWLARQVQERHTAASPDGRTTILCLGDSFTYGLGATQRERSYPQVLADLLEQSDPGRFRVVERARPGRASGEVLRHVGVQLATYRPEHVFLLVGYNDRHSVEPEVLAPDPVAASGEGATGFAWKWRTLALLRRIAGALRGDASPPPEDALLGTWRGDGGLQLTLHADGRLDLAGIESRWRLVGDRLHCGTVEAGEQILAWELDGGQLRLRGDSLPGGELRLRRGSAPADTPAAPAVPPRDLPAALATLRADPHDRALWAQVLDQAQREASAGPDVLAAVRAAIPRVADDEVLHVLLLGSAALLVERTGGDRGEALALALRAGLVAGDVSVAVRMLRDTARYGDATVAAARAALATQDLLPENLAAVDDLVARARGETGSVEARLQRHLARTARACRDAGATLCLLTYPEPVARVDPVVRAFARQQGVTLLDLQPAFREALAQRPRDQLFIADGHCADAGYALVAEQVHAWLRAR